MRRKPIKLTYDYLSRFRNMFAEILNQKIDKNIDLNEVIEDEAFSKFVGTFDEQNDLLYKSKLVGVALENEFCRCYKDYREAIDGSKPVILTAFFKELEAKGSDYGTMNTIEMGILGLRTYINSKKSRIRNLETMGYEPNFEKIETNKFEICTYLMLGILLCKDLLWEN